MFCLAIPLSMLALWYEDVDWIFIARVIGDNIGAIIILFMTRKLVAGFIRHNGDPEMNKELLSWIDWYYHSFSAGQQIVRSKSESASQARI